MPRGHDIWDIEVRVPRNRPDGVRQDASMSAVVDRARQTRLTRDCRKCKKKAICFVLTRFAAHFRRRFLTAD